MPRRIFVVLGFVLSFLPAGPGPEGRADANGPEPDQSDYLPLAKGKRWVLRSPTVGSPIVLEVTEKRGDDYRLRFDNPWVKSELLLRPKGGKYYLTGLTMNGQTAPVSGEALYFDLGAPEGKTWSNWIGSITVVSRSKTVATPGGVTRDCVQIRETNKEGKQVFWTFARGIGFIQFGEGDWAFVLDPTASPTAGDASNAPDSPPPSPRTPRPGSPLIGLSANTFANEPFNPTTVMARFKQSLDAGVTFVYSSPKWNELEPKPGKYDFDDLDFDIAKCDKFDLPLVVNLRIVDTNQRSMPDDLKGLPFSDRRLEERLLALIDALGPRLRTRGLSFLLGNEINPYFASHPGEVTDYAALFRAATSRLKQHAPRAQVSATLTFDGLAAANSTLKPILDHADFLSLTYYPLTPDFTLRDIGDVDGDFARMLAAAGRKPILLQEVGCPSSSLNRSSEQKQAALFAKVFDSLEAHPGRFLAVNFFLMSDLPDSLVATFAQYYGLPNVDRFKAFLKSLGMFDSQGTPKASWGTFRQRATRLSQTTS